MAEHEGPTNEGADDELAARLRTALDSRVEPVRLDEIELRARHEEPASRNGADVQQIVATMEAVDDVELAAIDTSVSVAASPTALRRRRWTQFLAAAAMVALLVGVAAVVLRDPAQDLETVAPVPGLDGPGFPEPAPGGIYDLSGGVLAMRQITAMAASESGSLYLGYTVFGPVERAPGEPETVGSVGFGVLEVQADDGSVVQDIPLRGPIGPWALVAAGDHSWVAVSGGNSVAPDEPGRLVRIDRDGATAVGELPNGPVTLAVGDDALWLRGPNRFERRDVRTGAVVESAPVGAWRGSGSVAAGSSAVWSVNLADALVRIPSVVRVDVVQPVTEAVRLGERSDPQLLIAGGSLLVVESDRALRYASISGAPLGDHVIGDGTSRFRDAAASAGQFWLVGDDTDAGTAQLDLVVIDAATGEQRSTTLAFVGAEPQIAALDDGAVVCVDVSSVDGDGSPAVGAECRRVTSPSSSDASVTATPGSTSTSAPTGGEDPNSQPVEATSTTPPTVAADPTTTTTAPAPRLLAPRGISVAGLDPIRLGMTPDELTAATGLATVEVERRCGQNGREVLGLPDGVFVTFNGDDTVRAVTIRTAAFATAEGLSIDSTVADLLAVHPDAEVVDQFTTVQYVVAAPDRSSAIFVNAVADDIEVITVAQGTESFLDLC